MAEFAPEDDMEQVAHLAIELYDRMVENPHKLYSELVALCTEHPAKATQLMLAHVCWFDPETSTLELFRRMEHLAELTRTRELESWRRAYADALNDVREEAVSARSRFPAFNSAHEGASVLREEFEEMWDEVKRDDVDLAIAEAIQVGAMAVRFIADMRAKAAERVAS